MNRIYLRKDIIRYMAKDSGYSQAVCEDILNSYHNLLVEAVENGDRVQDYGFLDIESVFVPEHFKTDPRDNNIKVNVKDKFKVKISVGKTIKDSANKALKNMNKTN